jgi:hypothetical protein
MTASGVAVAARYRCVRRRRAIRLSVGINREEYAARWTVKIRIDAAGSGYRRPTWTELISLLKGDALHEINEFRACMGVKRERCAGREPDELHRSAIRGTEIFDFDAFRKS